jgi:hypothetical protein
MSVVGSLRSGAIRYGYMRKTRGYGCFMDETKFLKMEKERMDCGSLGRRGEEVQIEAAWAV